MYSDYLTLKITFFDADKYNDERSAEVLDIIQKKKGIVFAKAKERKKRWKDRTLQ